MQQDRVDARIAQQDLDAALGGRIVLEDSLNLFADSVEHVNLWLWSGSDLAAGATLGGGRA